MEFNGTSKSKKFATELLDLCKKLFKKFQVYLYYEHLKFIPLDSLQSMQLFNDFRRS